jgi:hypothetical protein
MKSLQDAFNDLIKSGEGSRGGKVIGHTKSGKPIYDQHNHPAHAGFNAKDHRDAANKNSMLMQKYDNLAAESKKDKEKTAHYQEKADRFSSNSESHGEDAAKGWKLKSVDTALDDLVGRKVSI